MLDGINHAQILERREKILMAKNNLIIDEQFMELIGSQIAADLSEFNEIIENYINILSELISNAVQEGQTANALQEYLFHVRKLKVVLFSIGMQYKIDLQDFNADIDEADQYLF